MKKSWADNLRADRPAGMAERALEQSGASQIAFKLGFVGAMALLTEHGKGEGTFDRMMDKRVEEMDRYFNEITSKTAERGSPVQCEAKCSYCCYQHVLISSSEAFHIVRWMHSHGLDTNLKENAALVADISHLDRFQRGIACPLLKNKQCSVYTVRPMPCRSYFSTTRHLCKAGWERRFHEDAPGSDILIAPQFIGHSILMGSDATFMLHGHQMVTLELADAISQASEPGAWETWFHKHEPVFRVPEDDISYEQVLSVMLTQIYGRDKDASN